jgi:HYR domain
MRKRLSFPLGLCLLLFATAAMADAISTITPPSILQFSTETFITIDGTGLAGTSGTDVVFSDSAGTFTLAASSATDTEVIVAVPDPVLSVPEQVSVTVLAHDASSTRTIGPAFLTVTPLFTNEPPLINTPENVIAEATSPSGAIVTFTVTAFSFVDQTPPVINCNHNSGDLYPLGTTNVTCTATDSVGSAIATFPVVVADTVGPVITVPADIVTNNPVVTYTVTATDAISGPVTPICSPASGSTFPNGTTFVTCTAEDTHANETSATFRVSVNVTPPSLDLPANITVNGSGNPAAAVVNYTVTTDAGASVGCSPPSGSTFFGVTTVNCTATNAGGGVTTGSFTVTVLGGDTTPPVLTLPSDKVVEATGPSGATVTFTATAIDAVDGPVPVVCTPPSGSVFPLGVTTVHCSASDASGNTATGTFKIAVVDTTPPSLTLPSDIVAEATSAAGAVVTYTATAFDLVDGSVSVVCTPISGSTFPLGTTSVGCSATDAHGNTATGAFNIIVVDTTPPTITSSSVSPATLWPPDHKMVDVTVSVTAVDLVDPAPVIQIVSVSSDQPINGTGDGDTSPDWIITGPLTLQLRAERASGTTRTYTITFTATDFSGNVATGTVKVTVGGNKRRI